MTPLESALLQTPAMGKRRSLHSFFVPAFLHSELEQDDPATPPSPPPAFLLDDDPFANLSTPPLSPPPSFRPPYTPTSTLTPLRSRLSSNISSSSLPSSPLVSHSFSVRVRPASQKPAFPPRPSLPSLNTLAQIDVHLTPKKVAYPSLSCPMSETFPDC